MRMPARSLHLQLKTFYHSDPVPARQYFSQVANWVASFSQLAGRKDRPAAD